MLVICVERRHTRKNKLIQFSIQNWCTSLPLMSNIHRSIFMSFLHTVTIRYPTQNLSFSLFFAFQWKFWCLLLVNGGKSWSHPSSREWKKKTRVVVFFCFVIMQWISEVVSFYYSVRHYYVKRVVFFLCFPNYFSHFPTLSWMEFANDTEMTERDVI